MILRPEQPRSRLPASIHAQDDQVCARLAERDDAFISVCKAQGLRWNRIEWRRQIIPRNGSVADRVVELGCQLLLAGFVVNIPDELAERAVSGDYEAEHTRWVVRMVSGLYADWFAISWRRDEDFYRAAKRLRGARYHPPRVVVPSQHYEEVLDFVAAHDFRMSEGAQQLATEARATWECAVLVQPSPLRKLSRKPVNVPEAPQDIADEFKDDPL